MKKTLLVLIATVAFTLTTTAQEFKFGAKGGLNIASLNADNTDVDSRTSFNLGVVAEFPISEKFSFQPELLYSAQGAKNEVDFSDYIPGASGSADNIIKLDYINIPLIAKYYVANGFSIQAGPQIGFNVSSKSKVESGGEEVEEDIDDIKSIDFGLNFGLGYQFENGLFIDGRYNLGLSNINDFEGDDEKIKNSVFQFSVGYFFL